jgi:hypothetical protein
MWSSPIVFRRADKKNHKLCDDAKAWAKEARRRVQLFKDFGYTSDGDRVKTWARTSTARRMGCVQSW